MGTSITSGQKKQISRFGTDAVEQAIEKAGLDKESAQLVIEGGDRFREIVLAATLASLRDLASPLVVDCSAKPFIPDGWEIREEDQLPNLYKGQWKFDPAKILFHLDEGQKSGSVEGSNLVNRLVTAGTFLPVNVLDFQLQDPAKRIPVSWKFDERGKRRNIFFWTIYRGSNGRCYVRCLYWGRSSWLWNSRRLASDFGNRSPAALLAS